MTSAAKSIACVHPYFVAIQVVRTGDNQPPRLPNVVITPEADSEYRQVMSLQVIHNTAAAARLNPAARAS